MHIVETGLNTALDGMAQHDTAEQLTAFAANLCQLSMSERWPS